MQNTHQPSLLPLASKSPEKSTSITKLDLFEETELERIVIQKLQKTNHRLIPSTSKRASRHPIKLDI